MLWYETVMKLTLYSYIQNVLIFFILCFLITGCGNFDPFYAASGNPLFLIFDQNGLVWYSSDGERWDNATIPDAHIVWDAIYTENRIYTVTIEGYGMWTKDGKLWTSVPIEIIEESTLAITYGKNQYIAVGIAGKIHHSTDGTTWYNTAITGAGRLYDVVYGKDKFITVGENGAIFWSYDGISWNDVSPSGNNLYSIAYGHHRFVAVGDENEDGKVLWSDDGISWHHVYLGSVRPQRIIYDIGRFIVVGNSGNIWVSKDGKSWINKKLNTSDDLHGIAFGIDRFITVGHNGRICWSHDGNSWIESTIGEAVNLTTIVYRP
jgi:hypothetical protein